VLITLAPTAKRRAPAPTATTSPAMSDAGTKGHDSDKPMPFSTITLSRWFSDTALTRIRISPGPGVGIGTTAFCRFAWPNADNCHCCIRSLIATLQVIRPRWVVCLQLNGEFALHVAAKNINTVSFNSPIGQQQMNDRLSGIAAFVQVVESGSFALAAEQLHLTRSAISKSVARLEERLGVRLFQRTTRSLRLTDDGQSYYERCVRALTELEQAEDELDGGRREPAGRVRISMPVLFGQRCATPILLELARRHPQLELEMSYSDRVVDLVADGIDLAIHSGPLPDSSELVARQLGVSAMRVCAAPTYLERHGRPATIAELAAHQTLPYAHGHRQHEWRFYDEHGHLQTVPLTSRLRFDDLAAIAAAAKDGMGIAWLPDWLIADALRQGRLESLLTQQRPFSFTLNVVWPASRYLPTRLRVVVDALMAGLPPLLDEAAR